MHKESQAGCFTVTWSTVVRCSISQPFETPIFLLSLKPTVLFASAWFCRFHPINWTAHLTSPTCTPNALIIKISSDCDMKCSWYTLKRLLIEEHSGHAPLTEARNKCRQNHKHQKTAEKSKMDLCLTAPNIPCVIRWPHATWPVPNVALQISGVFNASVLVSLFQLLDHSRSTNSCCLSRTFIALLIGRVATIGCAAVQWKWQSAFHNSFLIHCVFVQRTPESQKIIINSILF